MTYPDTNPDSSERKLSFTRTLTIIIMVFTAVLIISLVLLYFVARHEKSLAGAEQHIKLSAQGGFSCEYSEAQKLYPYGDGVMKVTGERIAYITLSGNEIYSVGINYQNPACISNSEYCLVYDLNGYSFSLLNKEGSIYSAPTTNQIKSGTISNDGFVAIITSDEQSYGNLFVFDSAGNTISQWTSNNSGYPLAASFNGNSSKVAVTTVNTTGAAAVPYIRIFDILKTDLGLTMQDNSFYTTNTNDVISTCFFIDDSLYAFSSSKLFKVTGDKLTAVDMDFQLADYSLLVGDHIFLVYSEGVEQINKLAVINHNDKIVYSSDIGSKVNCVCGGNGVFAISVDDRIFVYNESGNVIGDVSVDQDILRMGFISGKDLCVVSTGGVHTINY